MPTHVRVYARHRKACWCGAHPTVPHVFARVDKALYFFVVFFFVVVVFFCWGLVFSWWGGFKKRYSIIGCLFRDFGMAGLGGCPLSQSSRGPLAKALRGQGGFRVRAVSATPLIRYLHDFEEVSGGQIVTLTDRSLCWYQLPPRAA